MVFQILNLGKVPRFFLDGSSTAYIAGTTRTFIVCEDLKIIIQYRICQEAYYN